MSTKRTLSKRNTMNPMMNERLRANLEQERSELQHRIITIEAQIVSLGFADSRSAEYSDSDQEILIDRANHYRRQFRSVVQALERFQEGTFGQCAICECPIGSKRLQALPTAKYCLQCQQHQEQISHQPFTAYAVL